MAVVGAAQLTSLPVLPSGGLHGSAIGCAAIGLAQVKKGFWQLRQKYEVGVGHKRVAVLSEKSRFPDGDEIQVEELGEVYPGPMISRTNRVTG